MNATSQLEEAICLAALEVTDLERRESFVEHACAGDARLYAAVREMLSLHREAEKFFAIGKSAIASQEFDLPPSGPEEPLKNDISHQGADEQIGSHVGRYKLLQKLGEGGCGTVYMAEQEDPVRRCVAIKVIKPGMDTKSVITRFEAERQALALMDHPNIARVLDAGATDSKQPFFVMELVRGVRITEFCDENNLDTQQRLKLFIQVCRAIQHAHQKGIIHRDIKPSNILVALHDNVPVPKVIDFGIAKAIEGRLTDDTGFTAYEQFVGTPAYMSPEQAEMRGLDIDTRSDIYSLGVLLYELLTARTPFDSKTLMQSGLDGMRKTLREREPPPPSTMITSLGRTELNQTAVHRHVQPPRLISQLKGDLDWIVLRALEKDRTRRYETANGLAMDVERYLGNEPVVARPPSRAYRLQKLVRRNKIVFASGAAVLLTLITGFGLSTWLFLREREAKHEQRLLREKAEQAELRENELRQQAEAREKINQVAIFVSQQRFQEANRLLDEIRTPPPKPSFDGVSAFRAVGEWLALEGHWQEAAERYLALMEIDKLDQWAAVTLDYQACGVVLVESGQTNQYGQFCRGLAHSFADSTNADAAGRVLKTCLLVLPDPALLQSLEPLGDQAKAFAGVMDPKTFPGWAMIPAALWCYRQGDVEGAVDWCQRGLDESNRTSSQYATLRIILALSNWRKGQGDNARAELAIAREVIESKFAGNLRDGNGRDGYWYDWFFARILLREAQAVVLKEARSAPEK